MIPFTQKTFTICHICFILLNTTRMCVYMYTHIYIYVIFPEPLEKVECIYYVSLSSNTSECSF